MNGIEALLMHRDLSIQVYGVWHNAIFNQNDEAKKTIDDLIEQSLPRFVITEYPLEGYRARIVQPKDFKDIVLTKRDDMFTGGSGLNGFPSNLMGAPPKEKVLAARANKEHESFLYLASDVQTACSEVQPACDTLISVSKFSVVAGLSIVDFRSIPTDLMSFNQDDDIDKLKEIVFCSSLLHFFSMPVRAREEDQYSYSQYITESLKKRNLSGILYPSSHNYNDNAFNFVLFDPRNASCIGEYGDLYKCLSINSTFQNISVNRSRKNVAVIEANRSTDPVLWNELAMLRQEIGKLKKQ